MSGSTSNDAAMPVNVNQSVVPVALSSGARAVLIAIFAATADHYVRSESVLVPILACSGVFVTAVASVWSRVQNLKLLRYLAHMLPDEVATVGKPPA